MSAGPGQDHQTAVTQYSDSTILQKCTFASFKSINKLQSGAFGQQYFKATT